tara:strand:+ start:982 stop:1635 length:654 start_codon:yes stop_codon:yes gene_type:complete
LGPNKEIIFLIDNLIYQKNIEGLWNNYEVDTYKLESSFDEIDIYLDCPTFNIIPDEMYTEFSEFQKKQILIENHTDYEFFSQIVPNLDSRIHWCEKMEKIQHLNKIIPNCNFHHLIEPMLINNKESEIKFFVSNGFIYITSFSRGNLKLANRFFTSNEDDSLYFLLSIIKETNLINENFKFSAYGIKKEKLISKLKSVFSQNKFEVYKENDFSSILK